MVKVALSKGPLVAILAGLVASAACGPDRRATLTFPTVIPQVASPQPPGPTTMVIEGAIERVSMPDTIVVSGRQIQIDSNTILRSGSMGLSFADLRPGARSQLTVVSDGNSLRATEIDVLDPVGTAGLLHGVISGVAADGNAFQFRLGGRTIRGDEATQVMDGPRPASASALRDGLTVDADGLQRSEYLYAATVTVRPSDAIAGSPAPSPAPAPSPSPGPSPSPAPSPSPSPGPVPPLPPPPGAPVPPLPGAPSPPVPPPSGDVSVGGNATGVSGSCPALVFNLGGTEVVTNNSTRWSGGACTDMKPGAAASANGTQNGNTVVAREVTYNR